MSYSEVKSLLELHQQEQLLQFWDELTDDERRSLIEDIKSLDLAEVSECFERATASSEHKHKLDEKIKPVAAEVLESIRDSPAEKLASYEDTGLREIAEGRAAVLLLAGGQGTRLGVDYPKGMYDVGLPSGRTLFHLQALRIKRLQNMAAERCGESAGITWYIMTSEATHQATLDYFAENDHFGLDGKNIVAFKQSTLPCFDFDGKIILDQKHAISRAPDGNGGLYLALKKQGILDDMERRGINSVHAFCVDNSLVKVADPVFLGFCLSRSSDCGVKVLTKRSADEPIGVVAQLDGRYAVVEYSEISPRTAALLDERGNLKFNSGNICNHYFTAAFLRDLGDKYANCLDLHVAKKKTPFVDESGKRCKPSAPNSIKIEKFVFDVFKYSRSFAVWEVLREEEFSPVKNADAAKVDCPATARTDLLELHKKWLLKAGAKDVEGDVEVCPLLSYAGENLNDVAKDKSLKGPVCLTPRQ